VTASELLTEVLPLLEHTMQSTCYRRQFGKPGDCAEAKKPPCRWCTAADLHERISAHLEADG
jgi:hypothetical protein